MSEDSSHHKGRRRDFLFGVILVAIMLPLFVLIERWLGFEARWLVGANCVVTILIFTVIIRQQSYNRKEDKQPKGPEN
jgi:hypothetical protein